jgi:urea transporter/ankyrin repeat protein
MVRWGPVADFVDACLRGLSEIFFASNPLTGLVVLVATLAASWYIGVALVIGVVSATGTAILFGFDAGSRRAGLLGYSGALTAAGIALFTFGDPATPFPQPWMLLPLVGMSALACVLTVTVGSVLAQHFGVAPFTLPFHLALWAWLLACQQSNYFHVNGDLLRPHMAAVASTLPDSPLVRYDGAQVVRAVFTSVSQVVFIENPYAGAAILVGLAAYSWISAAAALLGAAVGVVGALGLGIPGAAIYAGLWGYNPCLVGIALGGVFYVPQGARSAGMWLFAVLASVVVHGAIASALGPVGMPALTFPAASTCVAFCLLAGAAKGVVAVQLAAITVPEDHRRRFLVSRAVSARLTSMQLAGAVAGMGGGATHIRKDMLQRIEQHLLPALLCSLAATAGSGASSGDENDDRNGAAGSATTGVAAGGEIIAGSSDGSHAAARSRRAGRARKHLDELLRCGADASASDYDGRTAAHVAACGGSAVVVALLLKAGASTSAADRFGSTPLWDAIAHGRAAVVELLVRRGVRLARGAETNGRAASWACAAASRNDVLTLRLLLTAGCPASIADYDERTPLHLAAANGHTEATALLLQHGASAAAVDRFGGSPRSCAAAAGHSHITALLEERGTGGDAHGRVFASGSNGRSDSGVRGGARVGDAGVLLRDAAGTGGEHRAMAEGELHAMVSVAAALAAPPASLPLGTASPPRALPTHSSSSATASAAAPGTAGLGLQLAPSAASPGPQIDASLPGGPSGGRLPANPSAAESGISYDTKQRGTSNRTVSAALEEGDDDSYLLQTVLFCDAAAENNVSRMRELLADAGAQGHAHARVDVHRSSARVEEQLNVGQARLLGASDYDGRSPLHCAASEGAGDAAALLLEWGASVTMRDRWGMTPLIAALVAGHPQLARMLSWSPPPGCGESTEAALERQTATLTPTQRQALEQLVCDMAATGDAALAQLYRYGAIPVSIADYDGRTPLHIACACGHAELAAALVQAGASPRKRDRWGCTPEDDARNARLGHVVELMRAAAAPAATAAAHASTGALHGVVCRAANDPSESPAASELSVSAGRLNPLLLAQSTSSSAAAASSPAQSTAMPAAPPV